MIRWVPYAFIRIVFFFVGGIAVGIYFPDSIPLAAAGLLLIFLLGAYVVLFFLSRRRKVVALNPGFIGLSAIFIAGYTHLLDQTQSREPAHFINIEQPVRYYKVVISHFSEEKERSWKTEG